MVSIVLRTSVCRVLCSWIWLLCVMLMESTSANAAKKIPMIARTTSISLSVKPASLRAAAGAGRGITAACRLTLSLSGRW